MPDVSEIVSFSESICACPISGKAAPCLKARKILPDGKVRERFFIAIYFLVLHGLCEPVFDKRINCKIDN